MTNDNLLRTILICLLVYIASVVAAFLGGMWIGHDLTERQQADSVIVTVTDTVPYYQPVAKDSMVVRYETRNLKVAMASQQKELQQTELHDTVRDTVAVEIPITQKKYEAEDYRAYVSGYEPNLDSIFVREKTVRETVTIPVKQKQNRFGFGVGVGAGYGIINKKPDIFIGGTVNMRIF